MVSAKCRAGDAHWKYLEAGGFKAKTTSLDDYPGRIPKQEIASPRLQIPE
jgi:hypothetical protein